MSNSEREVAQKDWRDAMGRPQLCRYGWVSIVNYAYWTEDPWHFYHIGESHIASEGIL